MLQNDSTRAAELVLSRGQKHRPRFLLVRSLAGVAAALLLGCDRAPHTEASADMLRATESTVAIDWTHIPTGARLRLRVPKPCVALEMPGCDSECQKKNRVRTNGPGAIGLKIRFQGAAVSDESTAARTCPPALLEGSDESFTTTVTLLANYAGMPNFAWRADVTRDGAYKLAEGPHERGYYLVGPGPGGLLHYRYQICEPSEIDQLSTPLPSNVWTKPGGLRTIYPDDTASYGCRDWNSEIFSSPPDTPPDRYDWYKFIRAIPGEHYGCRTVSDFLGWRMNSLHCSYAMLEYHAQIRTAMTAWLEQFVVPLDTAVTTTSEKQGSIK